jgi:hypothetical protein
MATMRGFVERVEAGRGGLVSITVVNASGRTVFTVSDIDGDPERFNERLTKVALCRDAMNRAEPLEVETQGSDKEINRVARLTRDQLVDGEKVELLGGLVVKVVVESRNEVQSGAEYHDNAQVVLVDLSGGPVEARLDLQAPERLVAAEQLRMLNAAQSSGSYVQILVATPEKEGGAGTPEIIALWVSEGVSDRDGNNTQEELCGFVESVGTVLPAADPLAGSLALARLTTGPELSGVGGTVDPSPFEPELHGFYVGRGSTAYALLEAAVRENVRVRVRFVPLQGPPADEGNDADGGPEVVARERLAGGDVALAAYPAYVEDGWRPAEDVASVTGLLQAVELQAPLSSASRPVWVHIDREMLDKGPDADCVPGLPSSSLHTRSLRDLRIPYPAQWLGQGCFNHGVYRFQLVAPANSTIEVDGEPLCLFPAVEVTKYAEDAATSPGMVFGYACLDGDHVVTVQIPEYLCHTEFDLDVYRVR